MEVFVAFNEADSTTANENNNLDGTSGPNMTDISEEEAANVELPAEKLMQLQVEADQLAASLHITIEEKMEADSRSVYVGNVDYGATAEELIDYFHGCETKRVTILRNKYDGHPKGFAYIEFNAKDNVQTALALDGSVFRGRQLKVKPKRTNRPGISTTERVPRGIPSHSESFGGSLSPYPGVWG